MNFFHHKDLGNHLLQLCPKVVKHPVYTVYRLRMHTRIKVSLSGPQNQHLIYINRAITLYKTSSLYIIYVNELFPSTTFQQRQHVGAVGCHTVLFLAL